MDKPEALQVRAVLYIAVPAATTDEEIDRLYGSLQTDDNADLLYDVVKPIVEPLFSGDYDIGVDFEIRRRN